MERARRLRYRAAMPTDPRPSARARLATLAGLAPRLAGALAFRGACYAAMTALALANELRAAPVLPDLVLERLPYVAWVDRANYVAWLVLYLPIACALLWLEPLRWARYMVTGGLVSLARGACIVLTTLGPPPSPRTRADLAGQDLVAVWLELVSPFAIFARDSLGVWLSQDLFFSGHAATTFLLLLYVWHLPALRALALAAHALVVLSVMLAHLHYSIDVVGAWAFTFALFALREWRPRGP